MSLQEARRRGVPEEKFVFLHAHSDVKEEPYRMLDRPDFTVSPALRVIRRRLEETLGEPLSGIKHKEIYSCFPVAVRHAALQLGIPFLHASDICKTGGMQFHGGPGNNFSTHSIALMVEILRKDPGSKGLVTSNGGIFSKHSAGVYSTQPCSWVPRHVDEDQERAKQLFARLHPVPVKMNDQPWGEATVDLWTVVFDVENKPKRAIIIGTLTATSERFIAASAEADIVKALLERDTFGIPCSVQTTSEGKSTFQLHVMSSESLLEYPALFSGPMAARPPIYQDELALQYLELAKLYSTPHKQIKAHMFHFLYAGLQLHTDLRAQFGMSKGWEELNATAVTFQERVRQDRESGSSWPDKGWYMRYRQPLGEKKRKNGGEASPVADASPKEKALRTAEPAEVDTAQGG
eukprot:s2034_g7.t1